MLTGWRQTTNLDQKANNPWFRGLLVFCLVAIGVYALVTYV